MIALLVAATLLPQQVLIATPRGKASVPVSTERGAAAVAAPRLAQPLGLVASLEGTAVRVALGGRTFDFDLGAPFVRTGDAAYPLVGAPYLVRDTLFLPLHWLADYVPRLSAGRYRWDPVLARLDEIAPPPSPPRWRRPLLPPACSPRRQGRFLPCRRQQRSPRRRRSARAHRIR